MRKLGVAAVAGFCVLVGCQERQDARTDLAQTQQEASAELNRAQAEAQDKLDQARADAQQTIADEQKDVAEARKEAEEKLAEARTEANQDVADTYRDNQEELADAREEASNDDTDANAGVGGSGELAQSGQLVGVITEAAKDSITIRDQAGKEYELKANDQTRVMHDGKALRLENLKEGAEVRASYTTLENDKVVRELTVTKAVPTVNDPSKVEKFGEENTRGMRDTVEDVKK